ncbi:mite allergen Der p 3 [Drosophila hydei]|uniref:Mite allergen Der p 3 n=1 Tax=Drosophila hydei TaxID=7224 RepID=A0A6J2T0P9_DROHY|nr:mite allergen Der p 3 [Drosophila hydei]
MRLQLICSVVLATVRLGYATEAALQPAVHVILEAATSYPPERECSPCRCGLIHTLHRKIGKKASRHQYPWMAMVMLQGDFHCAGSLISDLYVLTAGHCVEGLSAELIQVRLLEHNRSASDAQVLQRRAAHVKVHELYNPFSFDNDIALIRLDRPVSFEQRLRPVCLPPSSTSFEGEMAKLTGWGGQRESAGFGMQALQEVDALIISQTECRSSSYSSAMITDNMLCARYVDDACSGNSGGPLHVLFDEQLGQHQLVGIVSWGAGCARPGLPDVYTRVNQYLRWIEGNTANACYCMHLSEEDYY